MLMFFFNGVKQGRQQTPGSSRLTTSRAGHEVSSSSAWVASSPQLRLFVCPGTPALVYPYGFSLLTLYHIHDVVTLDVVVTAASFLLHSNSGLALSSAYAGY